jgi:SAM-dependent methyltransferase
MDLETTDCPTCRYGDARPYLTARDINVFGPGEFQLVRCTRCSLIYINPRPTAASIREFYPSRYWALPPAEGTQPFLDRGMRKVLAALARDYPGGRVLDVGCGVGKMPALMRDMGLDAVGLEPYEYACSVARERYGLEVVCATLQGAHLPEEALDAITLFDVLEHVHDPAGDLRRAHSLLRPGGALFIKVPNIAALQASVFGPWWYWLDAPRHLFHFSPVSLRRALEAAGFADIECRALPDWQGAMVFETSVVYWLRGLLLRRRGIEIAPTAEQTVGEALEGKVYAGVPSAGKRAFRWLVRNVAYLPLAIENLIGRSVELLAIARR